MGGNSGKITCDNEAVMSFHVAEPGSTSFTGGHHSWRPRAPCRALAASGFHFRYRNWSHQLLSSVVNLTLCVKSNLEVPRFGLSQTVHGRCQDPFPHRPALGQAGRGEGRERVMVTMLLWDSGE